MKKFARRSLDRLMDQGRLGISMTYTAAPLHPKSKETKRKEQSYKALATRKPR